MPPRHIIVGTAGHIDHGKSALVQALTGVNPDRLEEEKRRGITIDLGFAFLEHDGTRFGFVDVPGHDRFVKNMLAGVGGIDLVMLVVAADESIKPQTREHFDICRLLAIPRGVAVISKADLVDDEQLELVRLELEEYLRGSFLEGMPLITVSARTGAGLGELKSALVTVAAQARQRDSARYFRLPVDRVFTMKGFGTVVTGTLLSGSIRPEQEAEVFPSRRRVRVRGIQSGGRAAERADAGQRTALNLAGIEPSDLQRGMVLATPGLFQPGRRLDVRLELLPAARPLRNRTQVHFHQGTAECVAEVILPGAKEIAPGSSSLVQLQLGEPVFVLPGDRFIMRQFSPMVTIGGGVVLDALAPRHSKKAPASREWLGAMEAGDRPGALAALLEFVGSSRRTEGLSIAEIVARTGWTPEDAQQTALALERSGSVALITRGGGLEQLVVLRASLDTLAGELQREVERFHRSNPLLPGITREALHRKVLGRRENSDLFAAALAELSAKKTLGVQGEMVMQFGRQIALSPQEQQAREQTEQAFLRAGLAVPSAKQVLAGLAVDAGRAQKILQILLREQVLVKIAEDLIFHRDALQGLRIALATRKQQQSERITVPEFKELAGVTRKFAIPLLEYLDRNGVTRRAGEERVIL